MPPDELDAATIALYHQVRDIHRAFIDRVDASDVPAAAQASSPRVEKPLLLIMPGAFHVEHPHTGADGRRVFELARLLDWPVEKVPVRSLAPMKENAAALVACVAAHAGKPVIVVSLSKGGADVRAAIERPNAAIELQQVRAWVNLSGIVTGTPLIAWLRARPIRCFGVRMLLRWRRQRFADVDEIRHGPGSPLAGTFSLPPNLRAIHVVGFPRTRDLSNEWARRAHARLAPLGPNDGGGILLHDVLRLPGDVYPILGADHYLTPSFDITPVLLRILGEAARPADVADELRQSQACTTSASAAPANKSTA